MAGFGISGVEPSGSATRELVEKEKRLYTHYRVSIKIKEEPSSEVFQVLHSHPSSDREVVLCYYSYGFLLTVDFNVLCYC
jgi:hypothetical protein